MDPTLNPAAPVPVPRRTASVLAWLEGVRDGVAMRLRWSRRSWQTPARPARLIGLSRSRLALLALAWGVLAAHAGFQVHGHLQQRDAEWLSTSARDWVDRRLDAVLAELQAFSAAHPASSDTCGAPLTAALLQVSLESSFIRRLSIQDAGARQACGPEGSLPAQAAAAWAGGTLALATHGGGDDAPDPRPVVKRIDAQGRLLHAELDSRTLALPTPASGWQVRLQATNGGSIAMAGPERAPHPSSDGAPVPTAQARSLRHALEVHVHHDPGAETPVSMGWAWAAVPVLLAEAGLAVLVWLAWQHTLRQARLRHRIEQGLRKRQFEPWVQPIVDLQTGRCLGGEVLMRWNHPERGILGPASFIEEAERTGLVLGMSDLVMGRAAHLLAPLAQQNPGLYFSFNVTPGQLRQADFAQQLGRIFNASTLRREQVLLEVTEREFVDAEATRALMALNAAGWRLAIDDFGTGHSSLASLEQLPIDRIKIDRAFVKTIDEQTVKRPVLDAIIALAQQLDVRLIAEGIETKSQWDYLAARGVYSAQGFLMAKPMAIPDFLRWLAEQQAADVPVAGAVVTVRPGAATTAVTAGSVDSIIDDHAWALWNRLRSPGGLERQDRLYRLRVYADCFIGREAVDWLVRHQGVSREEALCIGQRLTALGLIRHVVDEHDFADTGYFYRLVSPQHADTAAPPALRDVLTRLRGPDGLVQRDHGRGVLVHRRCATGRQIVDWLQLHYQVPATTATQWAAQLMRQGALRDVLDQAPFRNDRTLYRLH